MIFIWKRLALALLFSTCLRGQSPFQIHGYIQGRFTNQEGTPDRLEIRRARVMVSGDPVSNLSYTFQLDVAKRPYVMDAALTWKFSRALSLSAGQMKIPFSAESMTSDNLNPPVARARAVLALAPLLLFVWWLLEQNSPSHAATGMINGVENQSYRNWVRHPSLLQYPVALGAGPAATES